VNGSVHPGARNSGPDRVATMGELCLPDWADSSGPSSTLPLRSPDSALEWSGADAMIAPRAGAHQSLDWELLSLHDMTVTMQAARIEVRAWSNGRPLPTGAGYGVRLSDRDRDEHFDPQWREVMVDLGGGETVSVSLSESFWRSCPELRSAAIGRWLLRNGLAPWPLGKPSAALLIPAGSNRFSLRRLS
jgi:hypothetical protein